MTFHLQLYFLDPETHRQSQETLIVGGVDVERALRKRHEQEELSKCAHDLLYSSKKSVLANQEMCG